MGGGGEGTGGRGMGGRGVVEGSLPMLDCKH